MASMFIYLLFAYLLRYSLQIQPYCRQLSQLDSTTYDHLFVASEITLPLSDSSFSISKPVNISGSNCTYQIDQGSYKISGNSCKSIPVNISVDLNDVSVERTRLVTIPSYSFVTYHDLEALHVRQNQYLKNIQKKAFFNLTKLVNLTISYNSLEYFEDGCFAGLESVKQMSLIGNKFKKISHISPGLNPIDLPSLTYIDLRENVIRFVDENDFKPMENSSLSALILSSTHTEYIHYKAFDPLTNLKDKVIFTQNNINGTVVADIVNHLTSINRSIKHISLAANPLYRDVNKLLDAVAASKTSFLDISNNYFLEMAPGFFPKMPEIQILDISDVMIYDLSSDVINAKVMPNLAKLYLSKNNLRELKLSLPLLKDLDLSYINFNNLAWNVVFKIDSGTFKNMPKLEKLSLDGTKLMSITKDIFSSASNLEYLSLRDASLASVEDGSFANNNKLKFLDLSRNTFPIFGSLSKETFKGLNNLQSLDLSYSHISNFPGNDLFVHLKSLQYLSLRMNFLHNIDDSFFHRSPCLNTIDLRFNTLVSWNQRIFSWNNYLENIFLEYNHLTTLTKFMIKDFSTAHQVRLKGNSIVCDCQLVTTVLDCSKTNGLNKPFSLLPFNQSSDICSDSSKQTIIAYLTDKAYSYECESTTWEIYLVVSLIILFLVAILTYFIYRNYKLSIIFAYLTVKERLGLIKFRGRNVPMDSLDGSEKDAFVSYSCEDESFVEKMVFILENEGFDLLLYKRDFNAGDIIPDRILQAVESSRKTILVLSESFAKSQWCLWEMYIAHHRTIDLMQENSQDPYLILIKMSEIDESIMSPTLKHLLKTRVYLEWKDSPFRQKIFWAELKTALSPGKRSNCPINVQT